MGKTIPDPFMPTNNPFCLFHSQPLRNYRSIFNHSETRFSKSTHVATIDVCSFIAGCCNLPGFHQGIILSICYPSAFLFPFLFWIRLQMRINCVSRKRKIPMAFIDLVLLASLFPLYDGQNTAWSCIAVYHFKSYLILSLYILFLFSFISFLSN